MSKSILKAFELGGARWQDLPEENKTAFLVRWHQYCFKNTEWINEDLYVQTLKLALESI